MRKLIICSIIIGYFVVVNTFGAEPTVLAEYQVICNRADVERKHVLIEVFSSNIIESRMVRDRCFKDTKVRALIDKNFIEYIVESGQQLELEKRYGIERFPTVLIIRSDGSEVDRLAGGFFSKTLIGVLAAVSEGKPELPKLKELAADINAGVAAHMSLANAFAIRGAKREALTEYLWCLKQGPKVDANGYRSALSSILLRIQTLTAHLPEAATALSEQRAVVEAAVKFDNPASVKAAFEFYTVLQEHDQNLKLYDSLPSDSPLRRNYFGSVFGELVKQRRYVDAVAVLDLESYVNAAYPLAYNDDDVVGEPDESEQEKQNREALEGRRIQRISRLTVTAVEALLGVSKLEKAKRLVGRALEGKISRDFKYNLVHSANRAATPAAEEFLLWLEKQVTASVK